METWEIVLQADGRELQGRQRELWQNGRFWAGKHLVSFYGNQNEEAEWEVWGKDVLHVVVEFSEGGHTRLGKLMEWGKRYGVVIGCLEGIRGGNRLRRSFHRHSQNN